MLFYPIVLVLEVITLPSYFQISINTSLFYISAASGISHQPTFKNVGFSASMDTVSIGAELVTPNYKEYIDAGLLRRMSKILRMSVACAKECILQAGIEQPDSIVVGTGLGCLQDTEKFLNTFLSVEGLLPPTSFIQSTHNTIAGQISLGIGNHGYNMTHTQNTLSFEHALIDAELLLNEEDLHVLVGAADEHIPFLDTVKDALDFVAPVALTSGSSFFIASREKSEKALVRIVDVEAIGLVRNIGEEIESFLSGNDLAPSALDLVLFSGSDIGVCAEVLHYLTTNGVQEETIEDYLPFSGIYPTASAFALHYAIDRLHMNGSLNNVLICNCLNDSNLGLILVQSLEA
jgi:3-oxoacyl-[acyl-carrier-protein] synthase II